MIHEVFRGDGAGGWRVARLVMAGQRMEGWEKGQGGGGGREKNGGEIPTAGGTTRDGLFVNANRGPKPEKDVGGGGGYRKRRSWKRWKVVST